VTADGFGEEEARLLTGLLEAEHAVLYAYGVLGARLDDATQPAAQTAASAHRSWRDRLAGLLRDRDVEPAPPRPAYEVAVSGQQDALALAVRLESGLGIRFRDLVGATDDPRLRRLAVDGLTETAVRAASWRLLLGERPPTVALPGTG
jgi:hypothetical protein